MKKPLASFLGLSVLALFAACSSGDSAAVGVYGLDVDALIASMPEAQAMEANAKEAMKKSMTGSVELKADHTASMSMMGMSDSGTWKLDGKTLTFTTKKDGKDEPKTGTLADGAITVTDEKMGKKMTLVFRKK